MSRPSRRFGGSKKAVDSLGEFESLTPISPDETQPYQWDGDTQGLLGIAHGNAGVVFELDNDKVVKVYLGRDSRSIENFETERQAYRLIERSINSCDHVLRCYDLDNPYGLVLERCHESVRQRIDSAEYSPQKEAMKFAVQAAKGLAFIHRCGIRQGDVGCQNMVLDYSGTLKLTDFAGSSVDGCKFSSSVDYGKGSKLPGTRGPTERADVFALGSAIYEMITRERPYDSLNYAEVNKRFKEGIFPSNFGDFLNLGRIVQKCWGQGGKHYKTAEQVLGDLYKLSTSTKFSLNIFDFPREAKHLKHRAAQLVSSAEGNPTVADGALAREESQEHVQYVAPSRAEKGSREWRKDRRTHNSKTFADYPENDYARYKRVDDGMDSLTHMVKGIFCRDRKPASRKKNHHH